MVHHSVILNERKQREGEYRPFLNQCCDGRYQHVHEITCRMTGPGVLLSSHPIESTMVHPLLVTPIVCVHCITILHACGVFDFHVKRIHSTLKTNESIESGRHEH